MAMRNNNVSGNNSYMLFAKKPEHKMKYTKISDDQMLGIRFIDDTAILEYLRDV